MESFSPDEFERRASVIYLEIIEKGQSKGKKKAAVSMILWMCCSLFSLWEWSEIEGEIRLGRKTHSLCQNR